MLSSNSPISTQVQQLTHTSHHQRPSTVATLTSSHVIKKMAKIKPMPSNITPQPQRPALDGAASSDDLIKYRTPVKAVWRHKPIVHSLSLPKNDVTLPNLVAEHVFLNDDPDSPRIPHSESLISISDSSECATNDSSAHFMARSPSPNSNSSISSSFVFNNLQQNFQQNSNQNHNQNPHQNQHNPQNPKQFYDNESESDYIVIHNQSQSNLDSESLRNFRESSSLRDMTFIEEYSDDSLNDELDQHFGNMNPSIEIDSPESDNNDDLLLDDEEELYSSSRSRNSKKMVNYFMSEIHENVRAMEEDIKKKEERFNRNFLFPPEAVEIADEDEEEEEEEHSKNNRELVYDFPIFIPPYGYGLLETILEEEEEDEEANEVEIAKFERVIRQYSDMLSDYSDNEEDESVNDAIAENLLAVDVECQSFISDDVFKPEDDEFDSLSADEKLSGKTELNGTIHKERNDSGIKSSSESFASSTTTSISTSNSIKNGPLHQSEEELLSPNEDFGPESRSAHRKLLTIGYGQQHQHHPDSPDNNFFFFNNGHGPIPDAAGFHHHHLLDQDAHAQQQFLIPPPSNLGFSGSSTDGDDLDRPLHHNHNGIDDSGGSLENHDYSSTTTTSSSTTTTGCLIAEAAAEINRAAEEVIAPSSISSTNGGTPTPTTTTTESTNASVCDSEQFSYPTISAATATLTGAVLGGDLPGLDAGAYYLNPEEASYYLNYPGYFTISPQNVAPIPYPRSDLVYHQTELPQQPQQTQQPRTRRTRKTKRTHRHHHRKGHISLVDPNQSSDQASDVAPLDLSPDGGSDESDSDSGSLSSSSGISRSDLSDDSDETDERASTIKRRIVIDKNNNEKMATATAQAQGGGLGPTGVPVFKAKVPKNIWSPCSSSTLGSPTSPQVHGATTAAALLNSGTEASTNSDLYSDQIPVQPFKPQIPVTSGAPSSFSQQQQFGQQLLNQQQQQHQQFQQTHYFAQHHPVTLADYQAQQQRQGPSSQSLDPTQVPPPFSSTTYAEFDSPVQSQRHPSTRGPVHPPPPLSYQSSALAQHPTEPPAIFSSSTLPRSMNIMMEQQEQQVPHVAEVYQPRQHPTHKYWTLPRSIATGLPIPNGGPYIERQTSETEVTSVVFDEVDRFNQHHEQLQQTRIKEIAEQHMKPIASTTTTTASATTVQEEISKGFSTTLTASSSSKQIIQQVVARDKPPEGATLLYETEDATFYTIPVQDDQQELDQGVEATSSKTVRTTTYAVPKKKLDEGIGPLNESGVPITPKAGVKSEHGSEWYKAWVRKMHKMERAGRDDSSNSVCVKVKSPRYKGSGGDYHLAVEGEGRGSLPKYVPGNIADYEPGRTSIFERERQLENFPQPQTSSQPPTGKSTTASSSYYHENCVFNQLTGQKGPGQNVGGGQGSSVSGGSGYDSDSSYIIKKNKPKLASKPASPAVYRAVQRGEDIPLQGLARPTPPKQMPRKAYQQDYDEPEYESEDVPEGAYSGTNGYGKSKSRDEWNQLDEWQSQIETDFDYIYSTLQSVGSKSSGRQPKTSTPYPEVSKRTSSLGSSSTTTTQKKSVAFNDREEIQMIEEIEDEIDAGSYDLMNGNGFGDEGEIEDEVEEEEYSYAGLLRPGSHKPMGTAKSLDHFLNTQDLNKNVQKLKTPSGADDRIRVRKHRRRRSRSPGGSKSPSRSQTRESEDRDSDYSYDRLPPSYYPPSANKTGSSSSGAQDPIITQRTTTTTIYAAQPNEGKLNVQYRMPTNKFGVAGDLDITTASTTSTVTAKNTGRYGYGSGVTSPAGSTTIADSSFSTIVKQPLQPSRPSSTPTGTLVHAHRGPCGEEDSHQHQKGYRMERHHYMPTAMSPVALDRYERAFADNKENEPKKIARVIYDFQALGRNELAVKKGDLVVVRKSVNPNWVEVEDSASGLVGFVPRTYLDFEQHGIAKARFDFIAKTNVEISFKKGEKLTLLRRVDSNWYEGINEKQDVGIFPVTYVEAIKQPIEIYR